MTIHHGWPRVAALLGLALAAGAPAAQDDELLVVAPRDLRKVWVLDRESWKSSVDQAAVKELGAGCAAVSFVIEPDGSTSGARVLRGKPAQVFDEVAKQIAASLRFAPTPDNPGAEAVFTYLTITFRGQASGSKIGKSIVVGDAVDRLCAVAGFR